MSHLTFKDHTVISQTIQTYYTMSFFIYFNKFDQILPNHFLAIIKRVVNCNPAETHVCCIAMVKND